MKKIFVIGNKSLNRLSSIELFLHPYHLVHDWRWTTIKFFRQKWQVLNFNICNILAKECSTWFLSSCRARISVSKLWKEPQRDLCTVKLLPVTILDRFFRLTSVWYWMITGRGEIGFNEMARCNELCKCEHLILFLLYFHSIWY